MQLYYSQTSPYSRKVRVFIAEKGLSDRISLVLCSPFEDGDTLQQFNPLGKVPTLVLDDGSSLYDSRVICEYLDGLDSSLLTIAPSGMERWQILRLQALADGMMDAIFSITTENRRTDAERSLKWIERWQAGITRSLDVLETEIHHFPTDINLSHIAVGCALAQLDFRLPNLNWHSRLPNLSKWYTTFALRDSMVNTQLI